jgi:tRNA threonylcarbamoyladenosine biosynthesis protein TsaE
MTTPSPSTGRPLVVVSTSPAQTLALGRRLAALIRPGDVILLVGRLGAGKTLFASGVAEGLGVQETVTSPTFVLVRSYDGFLPVHHADVYRLGSTAEFDDLDLLSDDEGVLLIEWGDVVAGAIPADHLVVRLEAQHDESRTVVFSPQGDWAARSLDGLVA